jgi:hypothetical protein
MRHQHLMAEPSNSVLSAAGWWYSEK